jgi:hypothetical protein
VKLPSNSVIGTYPQVVSSRPQGFLLGERLNQPAFPPAITFDPIAKQNAISSVRGIPLEIWKPSQTMLFFLDEGVELLAIHSRLSKMEPLIFQR